MSGGRYDYKYRYIEELADEVGARTSTPLRKAFANHLDLVAQAAHDIERVDSCDYSPGDEDEAIRKIVSHDDVVKVARDDLALAIEEAKKVLEKLDV